MGRHKVLEKSNLMPDKASGYHRSDEQYLEAIYATHGNVTNVAKMLGLSEPSVPRRRIMNDPVLKEAMLEAREQLKDVIEDAFFKKIQEGDRFVIIQAIKSSLMRSRGFGNKLEIESTSTTKNLNVNLDNLTTEELIQYEQLITKAITSDSVAGGNGNL